MISINHMKNLLILAFSFIYPAIAYADILDRVIDNRLPDALVYAEGSTPQSLSWQGDTLYFSAELPDQGREPWSSDGSTAGTKQIADLIIGRGGSHPMNFISVGNMTYFSAFSLDSGRELWVTDGTSVGTLLVSDIISGTESSDPIPLIAIGNKLLLTVSTPGTGRELWVSDGTQNGTEMLADAYAGPGAYQFSNFVTFGGKVIYTVKSNAQLWSTDGTPTGTQRLVGASGYAKTEFGGQLYVTNGNQLYRLSSPTATPDVIANASNPISTVASTDNLLYFQSGTELWRTDATLNGTFAISAYTGDLRSKFATVKDRLYFLTATNQTSQLYWTTGSDETTSLVTELPGLAIIYGAVNYRVLLNIGLTLWSSDGTAAGTNSLDVYFTSQTIYDLANDYMYFSRYPEGFFGHELWRTDGTVSGTLLVKDIHTANPKKGSVDTNMSVINDRLIFSDYLGVYAIDAGTVKRQSAAQPISNFVDAQHANEYFYTSKNGLIRSNGISGTTVSTGEVRGIASTSGKVYYSDYVNTGISVWYYNDATQSSELVTDFSQFSTSDKPLGLAGMTGLNGNLFFISSVAHNDWMTRPKMWFSDGTLAGTVVLNEMPDWRYTSFLEEEIQSIVVGNTIYFSVENTTGGLELWKTDGTVAGTVSIEVLNTRASFANLHKFTELNGKLVYAVNDIPGFEPPSLWVTDGTPNGAIKLLDSVTQRHDAPIEFIVNNNKIFLTAIQPGFGSEPWVTDGTIANTFMLQDISPGNTGSTPNHYMASGTDVYFRSGSTKLKLWKTDGTIVGTNIMVDYFQNTVSSNVSSPVNINDDIYFLADDGTGQAIWKYTVGELAPFRLEYVQSRLPVNLVTTNLHAFATMNDRCSGFTWWQITPEINTTTHQIDLAPCLAGPVADPVALPASIAIPNPLPTQHSFSFVDQTDVQLSTLVTSDTIVISGLSAAMSISIAGGEYSLNAGGFTNIDGTVTDGDSIQLRSLSSASYNTTVDAVLTIGTVSDTFSVTTRFDATSPDTTPDSFSFIDQSGVAPGNVVTSDSITISGLTAAATITISGGEYRIDGGNWVTTAGFISNNSSLQIRTTASMTAGQSVNVTVTVGGISDTFSVTTVPSSTTTNAGSSGGGAMGPFFMILFILVHVTHFRRKRESALMR